MRAEQNCMPLQVAAHDRTGLGDGLVEVQRPNTRGDAPEEPADAADNVTCTSAVALDQAEVVPGFLDIRWLSR